MQFIAVVACVLAAVLGAISLTSHASSLQPTVGYVTDVWMLSWLILNKAYTREYWVSVGRPIKEIIKAPPPSSRLAQVVSFGMIVLVIIDTVLRIVS